MKINTSLFGIFSLTVSGLAIWLWVLQFINPYHADKLDIATFYISLLVFISGFLTFILFQIRINLNHNIDHKTLISTCARHGVLIGLSICGVLFFNMLQVLNIWTVVVYLVLIFGIELFFQTKPLVNSDDR